MLSQVTWIVQVGGLFPKLVAKKKKIKFKKSQSSIKISMGGTFIKGLFSNATKMQVLMQLKIRL